MKARLKRVTEIKRRATEGIQATYEEMRTPCVLLEGIARGERAFAEGRVVAHPTAKKHLSRWLSPLDT